VLILTASVLSVFGLKMHAVAKIDQCVEVRVNDENDVAALAAVPAVRTAEGNEFFAAKGNRAITAGTRADKNLGLVEKEEFGSVAHRG
jgi:hypothetical protein